LLATVVINWGEMWMMSEKIPLIWEYVGLLDLFKLQKNIVPLFWRLEVHDQSVPQRWFLLILWGMSLFHAFLLVSGAFLDLQRHNLIIYFHVQFAFSLYKNTCHKGWGSHLTPVWLHPGKLYL
jgi:hypothetical protein